MDQITEDRGEGCTMIGDEEINFLLPFPSGGAIGPKSRCSNIEKVIDKETLVRCLIEASTEEEWLSLMVGIFLHVISHQVAET